MRIIVQCSAVALGLLAVSQANAAPADPRHYETELMPPGFQVLASELEGPVFADSLAKFGGKKSR